MVQSGRSARVTVGERPAEGAQDGALAPAIRRAVGAVPCAISGLPLVFRRLGNDREVVNPARPLGDAFDGILAAATAGAGWAFERLWRSLAPSVAGYLRTQGAEDPDGLTSEVFLGVFKGIRAFSGDEKEFRTWVFTIAHRRLVDDHRRRSRRPRHEPLDDGDHSITVESAEADALRRLSIERVEALCEGLVPDQRDVVLLRIVGGLTVDEVARTIGKSPGAVKALQRRGFLALKKIFEREGVPL